AKKRCRFCFGSTSVRNSQLPAEWSTAPTELEVRPEPSRLRRRFQQWAPNVKKEYFFGYSSNRAGCRASWADPIHGFAFVMLADQQPLTAPSWEGHRRPLGGTAGMRISMQ